MSTVYLAMSGHRELETVCVVKRLLPALAAHPEHARRFRHEADLARRLVHSNLANTHNIGEVEGEVFLVQEFVEGRDVSALLDDLAKRRRSLPIPIAVHVASEIARGLAYAHAFENLNLVHRDINQPNVRLTYAGEVKLLDFGIASSNLHGERSGDQGVRGKLWHLAPEQIRPGSTIDRRTDIYAVGVLLWELLTGRPVGTTRAGNQEGRTPETEGEVLVWISRGQHQSPSAFNPDVSPDLDAVVAKAMHIDSQERYGSADELRRALAPFVASESRPEEELSALMKASFPLEQERGERQRLIESGRDLLVSEGRSSQQLPQPVDFGVKRLVRAGVKFAKENVAWIAPVALGALVGLACLGYLHASRKHGPDLNLGVSPPATAASSAPGDAPVSMGARPLPQPVPGKPDRPTEAASAPASGKRENLPPTVARVVVPQPVVAQPVAPPAAVLKTDASATKLDHLELARQAFNDRDWPRALAEAKAAASAGDGVDAHALVGNTYFKMGRFADAEKWYARAVALDPKNSLLQDRLRIAHARADQASPGQ
jgi:serine/threonine protein kinase